MMGKIVILGHTGFLGSCLYEKFSEDPRCEVRGFSSADIDLSLPEECFKLVDIIDEDTAVIMAATSLIKNKDSAFFEKDLNMLNNLARIFASIKVRQLVYISSIAIYGRHSDSVIIESSLSNPDDAYSSSKLLGEKILGRVCSERKIPLTILRPGTIYGGGDNRSPFFRFFKRIKNGEDIEIYGDGSSKLFWVHKIDLCQIIKLAISSARIGDYNIVANGNGISLARLVELIFRICGRRTEIKFISHVKDPINLRFDISKFKFYFPEVKPIKLEVALKAYLD